MKPDPLAIFRTRADGPHDWCAKPNRPASRAVSLGADESTAEAAFDAGLLYAELPPGLTITAVGFR